jgi:hypothetical protein
MRRWGANAPHFEWLEIDYPLLVRVLAAAISRLVEFPGRERLPNESAMAAGIDPSLHRRKA